MLVFALASAAARADGDPASDALLRDNVFYPYNDPVLPSLQKALDAETAAARHAHFPIKVALIQSSLDLGAVPSMFGRPQTYADFLEQEIAAGAKQPLLVVMPKGYGVQGIGTATAALAASLARPAGAESDDLARAAIAAIEALATRSGHRIDLSPRSSSALGGRRESVPLELAALGAAAIAAAGALIALRTKRRWLWSEGVRVQPDGAYVARAPRRSGRSGAFGARDRLGARDVLGRAAVQPLSTVAVVLICAGVVWAAARGLEFYGVTPLDVGYDLDQPPLLLVLVGTWLWYRSRRR
jgi:hypothetical protein